MTTFWDEINALSTEYRSLSDRADRIRQLADRRAIAQLRQICPDLPATGECFHLAHNWLVCKGNREAIAIIDRRNKLGTRLYYVTSGFWSRRYKELQKKYFNP